MLDAQRESAIAMALARRTYMYRLLHAVFGGRPASETAPEWFGEETLATIAHAQGLLDGEGFEGVGARKLGGLGQSVASCMEGARSAAQQMQRLLADAGQEAAAVEQLQSAYDRLFQIPGEGYVPLWESLYTGTELTVFQESTLDVRSFYHQAGFKLQAEKRFPDDHIAAMMDYLGNMGQRAYDAFADGRDDELVGLLAQQQRFLQQHVTNWAGQFAAKVAEKDQHGCYAAFAAALAAFCVIDCTLVEQLEGELAAS